MKILFSYLILFLILTSGAFAQVNKGSEFFRSIGSIASFQWAPERYENDFRYDIFYYIPESIKDSKDVPSLIFTHGGGGSTMTREGSIAAVNLYIKDLKKIADELGIIVVLPSANGLNWGGHTRGLMRDLARLMRKELDVDPDRMGVSGHSMGGMGITRNYLWTADEFAFYLPMAAGMDVAHQSEQHLNKVFNVPYVHLQGLYDHFDIFVSRCEEQLKRTQDLEVLYGQPSKLQMIFYKGSHNYDYDLFRDTLRELIDHSPRVIYQKELWGTLHTVKGKYTENNITFELDSEPRYFWVEATDTDLSGNEKINFHAKVVGQEIAITMKELPKYSKGLRVYLHPKLVDVRKNVVITINGERTIVWKPRLLTRVLGSRYIERHIQVDPYDSKFEFLDYVDIKL